VASVDSSAHHAGGESFYLVVSLSYTMTPLFPKFMKNNRSYQQISQQKYIIVDFLAKKWENKRDFIS
jgi:hypothetical protein